VGRVNVDDMTCNEPVEQHADRSQMLLDGRLRDLGLKILDEGGDMERLHRREFIDGLAGEPGLRNAVWRSYRRGGYDRC
jgi:hypothetical protein